MSVCCVKASAEEVPDLRRNRSTDATLPLPPISIPRPFSLFPCLLPIQNLEMKHRGRQHDDKIAKACLVRT